MSKKLCIYSYNIGYIETEHINNVCIGFENAIKYLDACLELNHHADEGILQQIEVMYEEIAVLEKYMMFFKN